ncbi:tRNA (adenosine(37)-N6)-dimethylallyltransferase MiaA [Myroides guanonis]|uniref:tRNA dimethylallyltransferase n=1 Tax=Myroides guanonis TaxID=1150112 RepID=A0A1I3KP99_9FLAO|nr:tRNA (adenosine(37)-N6)-dimethylallyltransferase MiaA [Myroides guanonis]SFI73965.1 tRNA dimethylallyltransferase [Myroides guanonis]
MFTPNKNYLIVIVGPTAIGKTALAIEIAKRYKSEILSCDSRQFFKEMTIGTAVPSKEELASVPHHFIQNKSIFENYSVGDFEREGIALLDELFEKNPIQVMVGGSGLYVNAILNGLDDFPNIDPSIRIKLNTLLEKEGIEYLQEQLKELDPEHYQRVAIKNPQRVIRALEICLGTGKTYSSFLNQKKNIRNFTPIVIGIQAEREIMYERINKRVDIMIQNGLIEEVTALYPYRELNALQTVGYREIFSYLNKEITLDFAIEEIKKNTRRFAKRQLTWFKKDENTHWIDYTSSTEQVVDFLDKTIT